MIRQYRSSLALLLCVLTLGTGCQPTQPLFFAAKNNAAGAGHLSHYKEIATDINYPDVNVASLDEVCGAQEPLTLANADDFDMWDLTLEEVTRIALRNSQVIRELGGRITDNGANIANSTPFTLQQNAAGVTTSYDPALVESGNGTGTGSPLSGTGVESALADFDAVLDSSISWQLNDRPQNFGVAGLGDFFAPQFQQDLGIFTTGITKVTADGTTFDIRNNTNYDLNNNGSRIQPSDWFTEMEAGFSRPLLQGAGTQYTRIAGPQSFAQAAGGLPNQIDGVVISRIRLDITLADFESSIRDFMRDLEDAYWELQFAYRDLEATKIGLYSAKETWNRIIALKRVGTTGGEADKEAQARSQYFLFRSQVETALTSLFRVENRLRYLMGIAATDKRLIRPIDDPTTALVKFEWCTIHSESLTRVTELRQQKWQVKRRELELIAARNHMLPRLDAVGRYRWVGAGDELIDSNGTGIQPFFEGSNAFEILTEGNFQEWELGLQFSLPIGFRRALSGVRHHQLLLARERAVLQDLELEVSHGLTDAIRDLDLNYGLMKTYFNRRVAAEDEVEAVEAVYDSGRSTLDLLLDAQRRRAEAESLYFRALLDYNRAIMRVHYRKGSLLEYNGVYLAEGPWPNKAHFDAVRRARKRQAALHMDYKYTRPNVFSRGPYEQFTGQGGLLPSPVPAEPEGEPITPLEPIEDNSEPQFVPLPTDNTSTEPSTRLEITPDDLAVLPSSHTPVSDIVPATYEQPLPETRKNVFREVVQNWQLENAKPLVGEAGVPPVMQNSVPQPLPSADIWETPLSHANEPQANFPSAPTAANSAIGPGTGR